MTVSLNKLLDGIHHAIGSDLALDAQIAQCLQKDIDAVPNYTGSVDACLDLLREVLPGWHWHVGHGANGILPYATVSKGKTLVEADGTTVPLVLLASIIKALLLEAKN